MPRCSFAPTPTAIALAAAVALVSGAALAAPAPTIQEALLRAKPAVALVVSEVAMKVTLQCARGGRVTVSSPPLRETGTGWFIAPNGWLVTNGHVVASAHRPPAWLIKEQTDRTTRPGCRVVEAVPEASISVILSNGIRLGAAVAEYGPAADGDAMSGRDLALLRLEAADMPVLKLGDSTALQIGDRVHIIGFPGVVLTHELLNASAKVEASITNGAVSGFKQDRAGRPVIQTDAPAAWGNSGGPAVDDRGLVVGVLTFAALAPGEQSSVVQGFNFVIPSAAVREFLRGTQAPAGAESRFDVAWHGALRDHFSGNYARAARGFAEANRLLPDLPDVMRLRAENEDRIAHPPPPQAPWAAIAIALAAAGAAAGAGLLALRRRRSRFRIRLAEVMRLMEAGREPVILDVREARAYAKSPVRIPNSVHVAPHTLDAGSVDLGIPPSRTVVAYCT